MQEAGLTDFVGMIQHYLTLHVCILNLRFYFEP